MNQGGFPNAMAGQGMMPPQAQQVQAQRVRLAQNFQQQQLNQQQLAPMSWQAQVNPMERASLVVSLITTLQLASRGMPAQDQLVQRARALENDKFRNSPDKNTYIREMKNTINSFQQARQQSAQNSMNVNAQMSNAQAGLQSATPMQATTSAQDKQFQPPFPPQLQHQMQPSALPGSGQHTMDANMTGMGSNPVAQQQAQPTNQQTAFMTQAAAQPVLTPEEEQRVNQIVTQQLQRVTKEQLDRANAQMLNVPPQEQQRIREAGGPVIYQIRKLAQRMVLQARNERGGIPPNAGQPGMGANAPPQGFNAQALNPQGMPGANFDFAAQMMGRQAEAVRSAESGQLVVPASNNMNMGQQMGAVRMGLNNGAMVMQGMPGANQMPGTIRQAPFINAQQAQVQAQNMQARIHAQQAQARVNAAQQMQLQNRMANMNQQPQQGQMPMLTQPAGAAQQPGGATPQQRPPSAVMQMPQPAQVDPRALQEMMQQARARGQPLGGGQGQQHDEAFGAALNYFNKNPPAQRPGNGAPVPGGPQPGLQAQQGRAQGQAPFIGLNQLPNQVSPGQQQMNQAMLNQAQLQRLQHQQQQQAVQQQQQQAQQAQQQRMMHRQVGSGGLPANATAQLVAELDKTPFPPSFPTANWKEDIPENVKLWGQLKDWISKHPQLSLHVDRNKITQAQLRLYLNARGQPLNQQPQPNAMGVQNAQAPGARMFSAGQTGVGPQQQQQQQQQQQVAMGNMPAELMQVTPQEMQMYRNRVPAGTSDDQLRLLIQRMKISQWQIKQKALLQQQQNQAQQRQAAAMGVQPGQQIPPQTPQQRPAQTPQPAQTRQPSQQPQQARQATPAKPGMPTAQMQQPQRTPQTQSGTPASVQQPHQGLKRPAPDDAAEASKPSPATATPMQASRSQQRPPSATNAQSTGQPGVGVGMPAAQAAAILARLSKVAEERPLGQPRPLNPREKQSLSQIITESIQFLKSFHNAIRIYAEHGSNEERYEQNLHQVLIAQRILSVCIDQQTWTPRDVVVVPAETLQNLIFLSRRFTANTFNKYKAQPQAGGAAAQQKDGTSQPAQLPGQTNGAVAGAPAQLSAANLEQQQAALKQAQSQRRPNAAKPPAAPTAGPGQFQHPFISSPQGVPRYEGQPAVTQGDLKFPPKKKQKTGKDGQAVSAASTPARATPGSAASPPVGKAASPKAKRQQAPDVPKSEPPKPVVAFKCPEGGCGKTFEKQEQLEIHRKESHPVIEDYLKFALDAFDKALGFNDDGTRKPGFGSQAEDKNGAPVATSGPGKASVSLKQEIATPAGSQPMARTGTQTSKPGADSKAAVTAQIHNGKGTPQDVVKSIENKQDPWVGCTVTSKELIDIFAPYDTLSGRDWGPHSPGGRVRTPALTPSPATSKDTADTHETDPMTLDGNDNRDLDILMQGEFPTTGWEAFDDWDGVRPKDDLDTEMVDGILIHELQLEKLPYDWEDWEGNYGPGSFGTKNAVPGWEGMDAY